MKKIIILYLLILHVATLYSQKQNVTFRYLTTDNGLSQISVNSIYVDERGVVWIGTREGLNSYNGNSIENYKREKDNPNSLFSNSVMRITGDQKGKIYLLCTEGVAELNLRSQRFTTLLRGSANSLFYNGKLYIGMRNEVYVFNEQTRRFDFYYRLGDKNSMISCLHIDSKKNLWIGTEADGAYRVAPDKKLTHSIKKGNISSIYQDSDNELWIGSWEEGLYRVKVDGSIDNFRHDPNNSNSLISNFVRACCEDNDGNLWIGTFNGLNRYEKTTGRFEHYSESKGNVEGLSHPSIWCITKDRQGTLWLGTYFGGVNYFNPQYEIYTQYRTSSIEQKGLSSPIIGRMIEDRSGNLWICTEGGGVNVYNRKNGTFRWFRRQDGQNSISHDNVKAIYYDEKREAMWIGTHLGGLNKLDLRTYKFTHYRMDPGNSNLLPSDIVRDIIPYKEQLIIGTQDGVWLFDPGTGSCQQLFRGFKEGKDIKIVTSLLLDKNGTLWIAASGVYAYRFDTKQLKYYQHNPDQAHSISHNAIYNIMQDSQGHLWFTTAGSGLDLYRPSTDDFENFDNKKNGLSSDCIYKICESSTRKGQFLLVTNKGFSLFDYPNQIFQNYSKDNGFPLTTINENGLYITKDGEVFLGGVQGMISFHEKNLSFPPKAYTLFLARLTVNGKVITPGDETSILQSSIEQTNEITLTADQSMFSIEYATSNFIPANRDEIVYQLEGFSDSWNSMQHEQTAITYTNLNPGTYTLVIRAEREGIQEVRLLIHVLPPWYKTWWAYLIYVTIITGLLSYFIQMYKLRIKLRESLKYEQKHTEDIEQLNQSKLRFFTNISHEFRTPLTLIVGQVETLLQSQGFTPGIYAKILGIYKSSVQLRELVTELLDFRKQEQGHMKIRVSQHNLIDFLYENYLLFLEYASTKQINFKFCKTEECIEVWYDQKQMQKVINNLLSNALKHTKAEDTISICVCREGDDRVRIEIQDTGVGIHASEIDCIFNRFYQTEQLSSSGTDAGTGIGLALTKGIVESHHGTIGVESELGKGSRFIVILKLGKEHFEPEQIVSNLNLVEQPQLPPVYSIVEPTKQEATDLAAEKQAIDAKILIVEDDDAIRKMLIGVFEEFYTVIAASDGQEGLELVRAEMPDIVLSDVVMPRMSGIELCKAIKTDFKTCHIPVVLLTARIAVEHNIEGFRMGADDYITKPFNINILVSRCNNLVNSRILLQEKFSRQPEAFAQILATNPMDKEMLERALQIIEAHIDDADFNINTFASEMGMARTNLFTKLKAITGQTPNDFVISIRLKKGATLLRNNPELNISEISERVAFSSPRYFSKCFKEAYNVSPMSYRNMKNE